MIKKWISRAALACAAGMALAATVASPAYAADKWLYLTGDGNQYASMVFVDNGDVFKIYDDRADGYGPTGYLQEYSYRLLLWETVAYKHNGAGDGNPVKFGYDITTGLLYRMKLCQTNAGCTTSGTFTE
jgi:hypothetical protein